jgi:hypothetical protein
MARIYLSRHKNYRLNLVSISVNLVFTSVNLVSALVNLVSALVNLDPDAVNLVSTSVNLDPDAVNLDPGVDKPIPEAFNPIPAVGNPVPDARNPIPALISPALRDGSNTFWPDDFSAGFGKGAVAPDWEMRARKVCKLERDIQPELRVGNRKWTRINADDRETFSKPTAG